MLWKGGFCGLTVPWNKLILPYMILRKTTLQLENPYGSVSNRACGDMAASSATRQKVVQVVTAVFHIHMDVYRDVCVRVRVCNLYLSIYTAAYLNTTMNAHHVITEHYT